VNKPGVLLLLGSEAANWPHSACAPLLRLAVAADLLFFAAGLPLLRLWEIAARDIDFSLIVLGVAAANARPAELFLRPSSIMGTKLWRIG
jgi:hypothetical protein